MSNKPKAPKGVTADPTVATTENGNEYTPFVVENPIFADSAFRKNDINSRDAIIDRAIELELFDAPMANLIRATSAPRGHADNDTFDKAVATYFPTEVPAKIRGRLNAAQQELVRYMLYGFPIENSARARAADKDAAPEAGTGSKRRTKDEILRDRTNEALEAEARTLHNISKSIPFVSLPSDQVALIQDYVKENYPAKVEVIKAVIDAEAAKAKAESEAAKAKAEAAKAKKSQPETVTA